MNRLKTSRNLLALLIFVTILAAACTRQTATESEEVQTNTSEPASPTAEATPTPESAGQIEPSDSPSEAGSLDELAFDWNLVQVGEGIKPAIDTDAAGVVHIAFLTEDEQGGVFYGNNASGNFEVEKVSEGYFYGPLDLAVGPEGVPYIAYHDHQDTGFNPELGDEVVAILRDGSWDLETVKDAGHDGWDNSIVVDGAGNWYTAAVDPSQFNSESGVEYATNAGGAISVVEVGSGPIVYEFGTSIQLDQDNLPGVAYYDNNLQGLAYAKFDGSSWSVEIVDANGDAGRYASLAYDANGSPSISYFVFDGPNSGTVRFATLDGGEWIIEDVGTLNDVQPGQIGARKITALAFDGSGKAHIAYTDRSRIVYGQRGEDGWALQEVPHLTDQSLGQLVEMAIDADGKPHLIWYELETTSPLFGPIVYASPF
ncbi:MAG: hypothetical protein BMS9Abin02_1137 [Anaerolineae bacterium]|nr:MAG: hypothetical protein BMS9Abin02_1137 [Anaerolineae bacterium]